MKKIVFTFAVLLSSGLTIPHHTLLHTGLINKEIFKNKNAKYRMFARQSYDLLSLVTTQPSNCSFLLRFLAYNPIPIMIWSKTDDTPHDSTQGTSGIINELQEKIDTLLKNAAQLSTSQEKATAYLQAIELYQTIVGLKQNNPMYNVQNIIDIQAIVIHLLDLAGTILIDIGNIVDGVQSLLMSVMETLRLQVLVENITQSVDEIITKYIYVLDIAKSIEPVELSYEIIAQAYHQLGITYILGQEYTNAQIYLSLADDVYQKALDYSLQINDLVQHANLSHNYANVLLLIAQLDFKKGQKLAQQSQLSRAMDQYNDCIKLCFQSIHLSLVELL